MDASLLGGAQAILPSIARSSSSEQAETSVRSADERAMFTAASSHVELPPGEPIEPLLARAGAAALEAAGVTAAQIDRLYGAAVLGNHVAPSPLYFVHRALG